MESSTSSFKPLISTGCAIQSEALMDFSLVICSGLSDFSISFVNTDIGGSAGLSALMIFTPNEGALVFVPLSFSIALFSSFLFQINRQADKQYTIGFVRGV